MRKILMATFLFSFISLLHAGDVTGTAKSYQDCVGIALQNSIEYRIQSETLNRANLERLKAIGGLLPDITLNHYRYYGYETSFSDDGWGSSVSATQPVFYGFSKLFTISEKDRLAVSREWNLAKLKKNIAEDVADAFFGLASAQADLLNTRDAYEIMTDRVKELKNREALGKSRLSELYAAQARASVLAAQLKQAETAVLAASDKLAFVMNADSPVIIQPVLADTAPPEIDADKTIKSQPEIKAMEADIEAESSRINSLHADFLPQIYLSATKEIGGNPYTAAGYEFALMAQWPFFEGGSRVLEAMKGYSTEESLKQEKLLLLKTVLYDLKAKTRNYEASMERVKALKDAYEKSKLSCDLQQKDYRYGMATNIEVMQAMADLTDIKSSYDRELITREKNRALLNIMSEAAGGGSK
ncbi:MAG: TolC family protein [Spirochaetia bacterium]|nr:TolC family protein [Spirochaetia bacterium]